MLCLTAGCAASRLGCRPQSLHHMPLKVLQDGQEIEILSSILANCHVLIVQRGTDKLSDFMRIPNFFRTD